MDTPIQVNGSRDPFPIPFRKFNNLWYKQAQIVSNTFPPGWVPDTVILEGMFLIQTTPLPTLSTMRDYVQLLIAKFVRPHLLAGVTEIHVVFDNSGSLPETPKEIEQCRRDACAGTQTSDHRCMVFDASEKVPDKWRAVLGCRTCKIALTHFIAGEMLELTASVMNEQQSFVADVEQMATSTTTSDEVRQPTLILWTNADEGDLRVWLHCVHSFGRIKLKFSPDTDVYHIGLSAVQLMPESDVVQLNKGYHNEEGKFLFLTKLMDALHSDLDLADIPPQIRPQCIQSLYVAQGVIIIISFLLELGRQVSCQRSFNMHLSKPKEIH